MKFGSLVVRDIDLVRPRDGHNWVEYMKVRFRSTSPEDRGEVETRGKVVHPEVEISLAFRQSSTDHQDPWVQDQHWVYTIPVVVGTMVELVQGDLHNTDDAPGHTQSVYPVHMEVETSTALADVFLGLLDGKEVKHTASVQ